MASGAPTGSPTLLRARCHLCRGRPAQAGRAPCPTLTSFVGRERELVELRRLLATTRLLTLTGAGGSGKSRLALQLAATASSSEASHGVAFVDLASLADPALIAPSAAQALGLAEQPGRDPIDALAEHLRARTVLLVLDNCEHLIDACADLLQRLLGASTTLRVVATSRESLGVAGEIAWPVPALSLPAPDDTSAAALLRCEAARLFVERARFARPAFDLTDSNAPAVARLCRQLDGMPLALELAAARVRLLPVEQIAERLGERFALLGGTQRGVPARHRTLRAAIDWSYEQLPAHEQTLWRCLSVFAGGFGLDAVQAVGALTPGEALERLSRLVDKSLVIAESAGGGQARFRLLMTMREYALERLGEAQETALVRDRHLDWCLSLAERGDAELRGARPQRWIEQLDLEHDNLRAALEWALAGHQSSALRLAGSLGLFWGLRRHLREGASWLDTALAADADAAPPAADDAKGDSGAAARALALHGAGALAWRLGEFVRAAALLEQSLVLRREGDSPFELSRTLSMLGVVYSARRASADLDRARAVLGESLQIQRTLGQTWMSAHTLNALGEIARLSGDLASARESYTQALEASGGSSDSRSAGILLNLGLVAFAQDDLAAARGFFDRSLALAHALGEPGGMAACLDGLAGVHAVGGDTQRAARLLGAADALRESIGEPVQPTDRADHERFVAAARDRLDADTFAAAHTAGTRLAIDEAIGLALARPAAGSK